MTFHRACAVAMVWVATLGPSAQADQIVIGGSSHLGAKVQSYEDGRLRFQTADGRLESSWVDQIDLLVVEQRGPLEDFNQAERFFADGDLEKAALRYERTARLAGDFWPELAATRLVTVYDKSAQIDKTVSNFIRVARGRYAGPAAAARIMPTRLPEKRDSKITRALEQLESALSQNPGNAVRVLFELLRYDILRRSSDSRAARTAPFVAVLDIPEPIHTPAVCTVLNEALAEALRAGPTADRLDALDRAISGCPDESLAGLLLLKGEALLNMAVSGEDCVRASWPFLRVAVHWDASPRAAEGLLGGGRALERAGRVEDAARLFESAASHASASEPVRKAALEAKARLTQSQLPGKR